MRHSLLTCAVVLLGCSDPVHEREVEALGPETTGVEQGPLHRPGQPCGVCHGEQGHARPLFSLSGTVYRHSRGDEPEARLRVRVLDAQGSQWSFVPNDAGNFYATADDFAPVYPLWIKLERGEQVVEMRSAIARESSCGACHRRLATPSAVGQVYFEVPSPSSGSSP